MGAMQYESFLREAFGKAERSGDFAGIADTNKFNLALIGEKGRKYFNEIKIGTGYAILTFMNKHELSQDDEERLDGLVERTLQASDVQEISDVVEECCSILKLYGK